MLLRRIFSSTAIPVCLLMTFSRCSNVSGNVGGADAGPSCSGAPIADSSTDASADEDGGDDDGGANPCKLPDSDGVSGGCYTFELTVNDTGFAPIILKAQNNALVTLTLKNEGTKPHDFAGGCASIRYPGCPSQFCFPEAANIPSTPAGKTATVTFVTPYIEGIYDFRSDLPDDSTVASDGGIRGLWGQFVVQ